MYYVKSSGQQDANSGQISQDEAVRNLFKTAKDKNGSTPLHDAAREGHEAVVQLLLAMDVAVDVKEKNGATPLHWAAGNGHAAVVRLLLAKDAAVDAVANDGATPLHYAAKFGHLDVVKALLASRAAVNVADNKGATPLDLADFKGHEAVVVAIALLDHGAMPKKLSYVKDIMKNIPHMQVLMASGMEVSLEMIGTLISSNLSCTTPIARSHALIRLAQQLKWIVRFQQSGYLTYSDINCKPNPKPKSKQVSDPVALKSLLKPSSVIKILSVRRGFVPSFFFVLLQGIRGRFKSSDREIFLQRFFKLPAVIWESIFQILGIGSDLRVLELPANIGSAVTAPQSISLLDMIGAAQRCVEPATSASNNNATNHVDGQQASAQKCSSCSDGSADWRNSRSRRVRPNHFSDAINRQK